VGPRVIDLDILLYGQEVVSRGPDYSPPEMHRGALSLPPASWRRTRSSRFRRLHPRPDGSPGPIRGKSNSIRLGIGKREKRAGLPTRRRILGRRKRDNKVDHRHRLHLFGLQAFSVWKAVPGPAKKNLPAAARPGGGSALPYLCTMSHACGHPSKEDALFLQPKCLETYTRNKEKRRIDDSP